MTTSNIPSKRPARPPAIAVESLIGQRSHRLVVIGDHDHPRKILCRCDCGTELAVRKSNFRSGNSKSCGCRAIEVWRTKDVTHGLTNHPLYSIWYEMMQRCGNPNAREYPYYGGRGIAVCERWQNVVNFVADLRDRPEGLSLDRVDNNGHYEPGNVRWATRKQQQRNRRCNHLVELDGQTKTVAEWCEIGGNNFSTVSYRLKKGWPVRDAIFAPGRTNVGKSRRRPVVLET